MKDYLSFYRIRESKTDERRKTGDLKSDLRSPIESDYGRLVFSSAFRRLHDKTQVFPLTTNDNIHSRLKSAIGSFWRDCHTELLSGLVRPLEIRCGE